MNRTPYLITLYRTSDCWMADMSAASGAADTSRLFGTCQLPTPYTARADAATVRDATAKRNPDHLVVVR